MKIIAQKTDFYDNQEFFTEVIQYQSVNGISFNVLFNNEGKLLVYSYTPSSQYVIDRLERLPFQHVNNPNIMTLEDALEQVRRNRNDLEVYLNLIPTEINIVDDESLKELSAMNTRYTATLKQVVDNFPELKISLHSISRPLALLFQRNITNRRVGIFVYSGDLTPTEVSYYVFPVYMINNIIFEELIRRGKEIVLFVADDSDMAVVVQTYNSPKTTARASSILPKLTFIVNQPIVMEKLLPNHQIFKNT